MKDHSFLLNTVPSGASELGVLLFGAVTGKGRGAIRQLGRKRTGAAGMSGTQSLRTAPPPSQRHGIPASMRATQTLVWLPCLSLLAFEVSPSDDCALGNWLTWLSAGCSCGKTRSVRAVFAHQISLPWAMAKGSLYMLFCPAHACRGTHPPLLS